MAREIIDNTPVNSKTGDTIKVAFDKVNSNDEELYSRVFNLEELSSEYDTQLDVTSENAVENKVIALAIQSINDAIAEAPSYSYPSLSIPNVSQSIEKGSNLSNINLDISFYENDGGVATGYSLLRNGIEISTTQNNTESETNITSNIKYEGVVSFNEGDCKNNNLGVEDCNGHILAGSKTSSSRTITPRLYMWYGAVSNVPTVSNTVRGISSKVWDNTNTINLSTGTSKTVFAVAVPESKTTANELDAQDTTNNVALVYTYNNTIEVDLENGQETYRVYTLSIDNPYPTSATHKFENI